MKGNGYDLSAQKIVKMFLGFDSQCLALTRMSEIVLHVNRAESCMLDGKRGEASQLTL
jgi:alpha-D-ribose 1-methylphosphonate 5-triphosphate synthase subunit PhnL